MNKTGKILSLMLVSASCAICQNAANDFVSFIMSTYSQKSFLSTVVPDDKIEKVLKCGIKAPSAMNSQLWKFTVAKKADLIKKVIPDATDGNVLIFISGAESNPMGLNVDFDCALATENMFLAAQSLGLAARIYTSPVDNVNKTMKSAIGIPAGFKVSSILRVGNMDTKVDATTAATKRKEYKEVVN